MKFLTTCVILLAHLYTSKAESCAECAANHCTGCAILCSGGLSGICGTCIAGSCVIPCHKQCDIKIKIKFPLSRSTRSDECADCTKKDCKSCANNCTVESSVKECLKCITSPKINCTLKCGDKCGLVVETDYDNIDKFQSELFI